MLQMDQTKAPLFFTKKYCQKNISFNFSKKRIMKSHTQNSISPAQLLLLLHFQLLLLAQLMQLTQLQILHFLKDTKVSKTILVLLLIPKMLQKFTGIDCSSMQVGSIKTYQAHKIAPKISNIHKNFDL